MLIVAEMSSPFGRSRSSLHLSRRETAILRLLLDGKSHDQVALELSCSIHTVRAHLRNTRLKLAAQSSWHAAQLASEQGLLAEQQRPN